MTSLYAEYVLKTALLRDRWPWFVAGRGQWLFSLQHADAFSLLLHWYLGLSEQGGVATGARNWQLTNTHFRCEERVEMYLHSHIHVEFKLDNSARQTLNAASALRRRGGVVMWRRFGVRRDRVQWRPCYSVLEPRPVCVCVVTAAGSTCNSTLTLTCVCSHCSSKYMQLHLDTHVCV
jgi:hypothetical protein